MSKTKLGKKLLIPVLAMVLIAAMAGVASADDSNYDFSIPYMSIWNNGATHIYVQSYLFWDDNNEVEEDREYMSCAYSVDLNANVSSFMTVYPGGYNSVEYSPLCYGDKVRIRVYNCYAGVTIHINGRYGS